MKNLVYLGLSKTIQHPRQRSVLRPPFCLAKEAGLHPRALRPLTGGDRNRKISGYLIRMGFCPAARVATKNATSEQLFPRVPVSCNERSGLHVEQAKHLKKQ